jgi:hypothetical protein
VQPVLIDRGQFRPQAAVQILNDFGIALHGRLFQFGVRRRLELLKEKVQPLAAALSTVLKMEPDYSAGTTIATGHSTGHASQAPRNASSMMLRIVRAHRPHCGLQPRH